MQQPWKEMPLLQYQFQTVVVIPDIAPAKTSRKFRYQLFQLVRHLCTSLLHGLNTSLIEAP